MRDQGPRTIVGGRFVLASLAGSGGMGEVYRAIDQSNEEPVALKLLRNAGDAERFLREAHVLSTLRHPAVVRYVAHGISPTPFLAMEWLEGEDLANRLRRHELTVGDSVVLACRVAEALAS